MFFLLSILLPARELFYYEAEYRCLEYCAVQLREIENAKPEEVGALKRRAQKAELKLKWEQNWLVSQLKWCGEHRNSMGRAQRLKSMLPCREYDNSERLRVFDEWSVPRDTTERKEKLLAKVWSNEVTKVLLVILVTLPIILPLWDPLA